MVGTLFYVDGFFLLLPRAAFSSRCVSTNLHIDQPARSFNGLSYFSSLFSLARKLCVQSAETSSEASERAIDRRVDRSWRMGCRTARGLSWLLFATSDPSEQGFVLRRTTGLQKHQALQREDISWPHSSLVPHLLSRFFCQTSSQIQSFRLARQIEHKPS